VDDDRDSGTFRGKASENASLAAVRVDDVRFLFAKDFFQLAQRDENPSADEPGGQVQEQASAGRGFSLFWVPASLPGRSWAGNKLTSTPAFARSPFMVATVFSCAPPTMTSRVMTWVTRTRSG
jgi:hypothetical protein